MSLINDALKRAGQRSGHPPDRLPPVSGATDERGSGRQILWAIIVLLVVTAGVLIGMGVVRPATTITPVATPPQPVSQPIHEAVIAPIPISKPSPPQTADIDTSESLPRLQGILYNPVHPEAIVNGRTLHIGDAIGTYHVKAISRFSVVLTGPSGAEVDLHMDQ